MMSQFQYDRGDYSGALNKKNFYVKKFGAARLNKEKNENNLM